MTYESFPCYPAEDWLTKIPPEADILSKIALHHIVSRFGPLPDHDEIRLGTYKLTHIGSYRPELALVLLKERRSVFGIIVEEQRWMDEMKRYSWPAFAATLRARLRCPVCVLVFTRDEELTQWAKEPIELGGENRFAPYVLNSEVQWETVKLFLRPEYLKKMSALVR
jgi:hypothetical protein